MRCHPRIAALGAAGFAIALALPSAGCSRATEPTPTQTTATTTSRPSPLPPGPVPPGAIGLSPAGVTTRVDVPADATESQYGQACHAAKLWLVAQQGHPESLVEPYLKMLQTPDTAGPGTFDTTWAQLTPAQQAGAIMAVNGAAAGECE